MDKLLRYGAFPIGILVLFLWPYRHILRVNMRKYLLQRVNPNAQWAWDMTTKYKHIYVCLGMRYRSSLQIHSVHVLHRDLGKKGNTSSSFEDTAGVTILSLAFVKTLLWTGFLKIQYEDDMLLFSKISLTLIRAAGGVYDSKNSEQV